MGSAKQHTIYKAELIGIILALHITNKCKWMHKITILANNQAAIKTLDSKTANASLYLVPILRKMVEKLRRANRGLEIVIRWVPRHKGMRGNKRVDEKAKKAVQMGSLPAKLLPHFLQVSLLLSKITVEFRQMEQIKEHANQAIRQSKRLLRIKQINSSIPLNRFLKIMQTLHCNQGTVLTQLRTGHVPLAHHPQWVTASKSSKYEGCRAMK